MAVNAVAPGVLGEEAHRLGAPVIHFSTDYVFDGEKGAPYVEDDAPQPQSVYGRSKLLGEIALRHACPKHLILRTSWVFGAHGNNFVKTMLRLGRERDELSVVADQQGCPTSAASIARALWTLAQQYRDSGALQWGLYHYSGMPACSWHSFAQEIFAQAHALGILPRVPVVHGISTAQYPTPAKRPAWSVMDCSRLQQVQQITPADWRTELRAVLLELAGQ